MIQLSPNVILLGNGHFNHYIAGHEKAALIEGGMTAGISVLQDQWKTLESPPQVQYILAMHSHFDHVCGIPWLRRLFPSAQVLGSTRTQKALNSEKACGLMKMGDSLVTERYLSSNRLAVRPEEMESGLLKVDQVVGEGDVIDLGEGLDLKILEVPGHSPCSIAAWLAQDQVMFVSDAAGTCLSDGVIAPVFFQDYDLYVESIKRLLTYPIEVLAVGHGETVMGNDRVKDYLQRGLQSAEEAFKQIEDKIRSGVNEEELARNLYDTYMIDGLADYPAPIMIATMGQLIKNVKTKLEDQV